MDIIYCSLGLVHTTVALDGRLMQCTSYLALLSCQYVSSGLMLLVQDCTL